MKHNNTVNLTSQIGSHWSNVTPRSFWSMSQNRSEFFDRKRFGASKTAGSRPGNKRGISQDLLALHTVNRAHSLNKQDGVQQQKSIKNIDLDKFQSCTRSVEEVDLGPLSPTPAASRLLLMEPKNDPNQSRSGQGSHIFKKDTQNVDFTPKKDSFDNFLKPPSVQNHLRSSDSSSKHNSGRSPHTQSTLEATKSSVGDFKRKDDKYMSTTSSLPPFSFQNQNKKSQSAFDPFATEDFQVTPLRKYSKQESPLASKHDSRRKREHNTFNYPELNEKHSKRVHQDNYSTSTPLKETDKPKHQHKHRKSKHKFDLSFLNSSVSPIEKLPKLSKHHVPELEDDFIYKPRPMVNTPDGSLIRKETPVFNTSSFITSPVEIRPADEVSKSSEFSYPWEKSNFGTCANVFDPESVLSRHKSAETSSSQSYLESVEKSNVFLRNSAANPVGTLFKEVKECTKVTPKKTDGIAVTGSNSSLARYRQKLLESENELNSSIHQAKDSQKAHFEKSDSLLGTGGNDKTFPIAFEAEFPYRPHRITRPDEDKSVDVMKLYQKHKETSETDGSLLSSQATGWNRAVGVDVKANMIEGSGVKVRRLSGGEAGNFTRSPKVAEEYPVHLLQQSTDSFIADFAYKQESHMGMKNSLEVDEWSTPGVNTPRKRRGRETRNHTNSHMEEVLQEMRELEQQDSVVIEEAIHEDGCTDQSQLTTPESPTEHIEVDHFLDSELKFWDTIPTLDDKPVISDASVDTIMQENQINETVKEAVISTAQLKHMLEPAESQLNGTDIAKQNWAEENKIMDDFEKQTAEQYYVSSITIVTDNSTINANASPVTKTAKDALDASRSKPNTDKNNFEKVCCDERMDQHPARGSKVQITNEMEFPKELKLENNLDSNLEIRATTSICVNNKNDTPTCSSEKQQTENMTTPNTEYNNETNIANILSKRQLTTDNIDSVKANSVNRNDLPLTKTPVTTTGPVSADNNRSFMQTLAQQPQTEISAMVEKQLMESETVINQCLAETDVKPDFSVSKVGTKLSKVETKPIEKLLNNHEHTNVDKLSDPLNTENDDCCKTESVKGTCSKYFSNLKMESTKPVKDMPVIQDPQVSSGCNQGTQTDSVSCIDATSSPFVGQHSPISNKSIGVQCNFESVDKEPTDIPESKVPKLGLLASSFLGSSYRKSMTLMSYFSKNLETKVILTNEVEDANMKLENNAEEDSQSYDTADSVADDVENPASANINS